MKEHLLPNLHFCISGYHKKAKTRTNKTSDEQRHVSFYTVSLFNEIENRSVSSSQVLLSQCTWSADHLIKADALVVCMSGGFRCVQSRHQEWFYFAAHQSGHGFQTIWSAKHSAICPNKFTQRSDCKKSKSSSECQSVLESRPSVQQLKLDQHWVIK